MHNLFIKCRSQVDEEDQIIILLASYQNHLNHDLLVTTFLVGKTTLMMDKVSTILLETENIKQ